MRTQNPYSVYLIRLKQFKFLDGLALFRYTLKWLLISLLIGCVAGSVSAIFLISLDWATNFRESHLWIIAFLPLAGAAIAAMYFYLGKDVVKGNNQLIEEIQKPQKQIPLIMAPLIFITTIVTHLFGGSAGREGTAVQMGGSIADRLTKVLKLKNRDRRSLLICGMSAGFASVFGTPLAGSVFALEVFIVGSVVYDAILPSFLAAVIADWACKYWGVLHIQYHVTSIPDINPLNLIYAIFCGILFGLAGRLFSNANHFSTAFFKYHISNQFIRPAIGGIIIVAFVWLWGSTELIGLGIPTIVSSFTEPQPYYVFLIKILLTAITLGAGFKGGEVTPLFFVGATLGSFISLFVPLPIALLTAMGFVGVFTAAANTPIACILMGMEMFGALSGPYIAIACIIAYFFSGHTGIYKSQIIGTAKHGLFNRQSGRSIADLAEKD